MASAAVDWSNDLAGWSAATPMDKEVVGAVNINLLQGKENGAGPCHIVLHVVFHIVRSLWFSLSPSSTTADPELRWVCCSAVPFLLNFPTAVEQAQSAAAPPAPGGTGHQRKAVKRAAPARAVQAEHRRRVRAAQPSKPARLVLISLLSLHARPCLCGAVDISTF